MIPDYPVTSCNSPRAAPVIITLHTIAYPTIPMPIQTIPGHTKPYHAVPSHAILITIPNCNIPYLSILCQCIPYHTKPYQCLNTLQFNPVNVLQITLQIKAQCKLFALQCSTDQSSAKPYYAVWRIILGCQSFAQP